jgi:hypothetical protein
VALLPSLLRNNGRRIRLHELLHNTRRCVKLFTFGYSSRGLMLQNGPDNSLTIQDPTVITFSGGNPRVHVQHALIHGFYPNYGGHLIRRCALCKGYKVFYSPQDFLWWTMSSSTFYGWLHRSSNHAQLYLVQFREAGIYLVSDKNQASSILTRSLVHQRLNLS